MMNQWQPSASIEVIRLRADTLSSIRNFFAQRKVLEVDTPILSRATVPDPFIDSFHTRYIPLMQNMQTDHYFLHTSPEFPMKRLLASGIGSIYQISKVFRQGEAGQRHNPEFTLLEWYREGWDHQQLMTEVSQLLSSLLKPYIKLAKPCFLTYQQAFENILGINPHTASKDDLMACAEQLGLENVLAKEEAKDRFLELLFSHKIEPSLGLKQGKDKNSEQACLCFLCNYPGSQAALAKTKIVEGQFIAERFEVFINGIELGNGFHELNDADEQKARFEADNQYRKAAGQPVIPLDENFLSAVNDLPDCAGVAIGIERLLMVMSQSVHINEVIAFPFERA